MKQRFLARQLSDH